MYARRLRDGLGSIKYAEGGGVAMMNTTDERGSGTVAVYMTQ